MSPRQAIGVLAVAAALAISAVPAHAATAEEGGDWLQEGVDGLHALGIPGVVAELRSGGSGRSAVGGVAQLGRPEPMPAGAHFHIASNTKMFTAVLTLQLVGEGRISLDDTVEHWLPGLVTGSGNDGARIKVRNLLQHTSGLVDYGADLPIRSYEQDWGRERLHHYAPQELVALSMRHPPQWLPIEGETRFSYSNVNYVLLGMIVEKATGHSFGEEAARRIFGPLKLTATSAPSAAPGLPAPHGHSYAQSGPGTPMVDTTEFDPSVVFTSGAIVSTTHDLNRFLELLIEGQALSPAMLKQMQTTIDAPELHDFFPGARYGLGLIWRPLSCGGGYWGHMGNGAAGGTRDGVSVDGSRSMVIYMSAELADPDLRLKQENQASALIDQALCGAR